MKILAIETSCDETSIAILKGEEKSGVFKILANVVSSQVKIHAKWGGVVPNLAAREHLKNIIPVLNETLKKAKVVLSEIDLIAITQGPGLIPALLIGINAAKTLAYFCEKPLIGIHHIEGHIYANYINQKKEGNLSQFKFPVLALVVSGGHTQLILMKDYLNYKIIGETLDDAAGEAFDKIAKIMNLGYPGGPAVAKRALEGKSQIMNKFKIQNAHKIQSGKNKKSKDIFPRPMINSGDLNFSFSGLKTAVLYFYEKIKKEIKDKKNLEAHKNFICWEAQTAIVEVLRKKSLMAIEKYHPQSFFLAGGVAANKELRGDFEKHIKNNLGVEFTCPLIEYCGDNAAMIAVVAFSKLIKKNINPKKLKENWRDLEADSNLKLKN